MSVPHAAPSALRPASARATDDQDGEGVRMPPGSRVSGVDASRAGTRGAREQLDRTPGGRDAIDWAP
jgi:hypothetical protein